jgi:hypothetical protein
MLESLQEKDRIFGQRSNLGYDLSPVGAYRGGLLPKGALDETLAFDGERR